MHKLSDEDKKRLVDFFLLLYKIDRRIQKQKELIAQIMSIIKVEIALRSE